MGIIAWGSIGFMANVPGRPRRRLNRLDITVGLGLTGLVAFLFFIPWSGFEKAQGKLYDLGLKIRTADPPPPDIAIVAIDDASINQIGRWPWPRKYVAHLIERLSAAGCRVIAVDLLFPPADEEREAGNNRLLGEAIRKAGNVVLAFYFKIGKTHGTDPQAKVPSQILNASLLLFDDPKKFLDFPPVSGVEVFAPIPEVAAAAKALGHINVLADLDGIVRREALFIEYNGYFFPSFSLQVAASAYGLSRAGITVKVGKSLRLGNKNIPTSADGTMLIPYYAGPQGIPYYSSVEVLSGKVGEEKLKNHIVFIGVTASGISSGAADFLTTPFFKRMPGVEKQAQATAAILSGRFLERPSWAFPVEFGTILILGFIFTFIFPRIGGVFLIILPLAILLGLGILVMGLFREGIWLPFFFPGVLVVLQSLWAPFGRMIRVSPTPARQKEPESATLLERIEPAFAEKTAQSPRMISSPKQRLGRYEILQEIGRGGMGVVYKGRDPLIDRWVAIKTIRFDRLYDGDELIRLKERFFTEARAAGKLIHPHIVTIFDVGEDGGTAYMAMEYVEGKTLVGYIGKDSLLPVEEVLQAIIESALALDFAHQQGIIHRDVKPSNIMRTEKGLAKVMDFGIAKLPASSQTQAGSILGTPSYMSPEQIHGWPVDGRSDLFSLGCVLYELLTGQKPFRGENFSALVLHITEGAPRPPSQENPRVPPHCDEILMKSLAKAKEERFQNGQEMARALREALRRLKE